MSQLVTGEAPAIADVETCEQPLSTVYNSERGPRETWNKKNPPHEAVIGKNIKTTELTPREFRNTKARFYRLGQDIRLQPHVSELPSLDASVNHRHTTEAVTYIVSGVGHSIISWDGANEERIDWEEGDIFSFPAWMWHQHFNDNETVSCRYLATRDLFDQGAGSARHRAVPREHGLNHSVFAAIAACPPSEERSLGRHALSNEPPVCCQTTTAPPSLPESRDFVPTSPSSSARRTRP